MIEQTTRIAANVGIEMDFDKVHIFNTRKAHELLHFAKACGVQSELKERLFRAAFTEGRDLGAIEVLVEIAGEAGMDAPDARAVLLDGRYTQAVIDDERQAQGLGVGSVPHFVFDAGPSVSGAQTIAGFKAVLESAVAQASSAPSCAGAYGMHHQRRPSCS
jgi:predicted DsbA family dithiol-disulfide isomerase